MSRLVFSLRRAFDHGTPVGSAKIFTSIRGELIVSEQRDERFRRIVRTAAFHALDGTETVPPLRNVEILSWASDWLVLTGVEELADDNLSQPRLYAQTWQMTPEPYEELRRAEKNIGRLLLRLHQAGIDVEMQPQGEMRIPDETWPDGTPRPA